MLNEYKKHIIEQETETINELIACDCIPEEKRDYLIEKQVKEKFERLESVLKNGLDCGGIVKSVAKVDGIKKQGERYYFIVGKQLYDCNYYLAN